MSQTLFAATARRILDAATTAEFGIRVRVSAPNLIDPARRAAQILYRFRNELKSENPLMGLIHIRLDPDDPSTYLWLIRGDTGLIALPDPTPEPPNQAIEKLEIDL